MSRKVLFSWLSMATLLMSLGACGLGSDGPPVGPVEENLDGGIGTGDIQSLPMQVPTVNPPAASTCNESVPIQGKSLPEANIIVRVGGGSAYAGQADPTGHFCVDVPLGKNTENALQIQAQLADRGISDPVNVTITQSGECQGGGGTTPEPAQSANVAFHKGVTVGGGNITEGTAANITDNSRETVARIVGGEWWDPGDAQVWAQVNLEAPKTIKRIVIRWKDGVTTGGAGYATKYKIYLSQAKEPSDPTKGGSDWYPLYDRNGENGNEDAYDLSTTRIAQHVAVIMNQNGETMIGQEWFLLDEIEVWDEPQTTTMPVGPNNTCATISSS